MDISSQVLSIQRALSKWRCVVSVEHLYLYMEPTWEKKMSAKSLTSFEISLKSQIEEYKQLIDTITLKNVDQHEIGNGLKALAQIIYNWI